MNDEDLIKTISKCMLHDLNILTFIQLLAKEYKRTNPHFDEKEFYKNCGTTLTPDDN